MSFKFRAANADNIALSSGAMPTTGTLAWWWKTTTYGANRIHAFGIRQDGSHLFNAVNETDANLYMGWYNGTDARVTTSTQPTNGAWTSMVLTYSPTSTKLYKNGVQIGSTVTTDGTFNSAGTPKYIGNQDGGIVHAVDSYIAEMGLWNTIVSGATITALAAGERPSCYTSGLVSYWALSANANDSFGSDNGTATGAASDMDHPTLIACSGGGGGGSASCRITLLGVG